MKNYKVSNRLILTGLGIGLYFYWIEFGTKGIKTWGQGICVPLILLWILYIFRVIGAGDIKLFSMVGGFLGYHQVVQVIFMAFIIGAFFSIIHMIRFNILFYRLQYLANYIQSFLKEKKVTPYYTYGVDDPRAVIPFSITIFFSVFILFLQGKVY